MACLSLILILLFPRVALALLFLFTNYLSRAFHNSFLTLILGFIFLPLTTLLYAWMFHNHVPVEGINIVWLMAAVLLDLGLVGGGYQRHRTRT